MFNPEDTDYSKRLLRIAYSELTDEQIADDIHEHCLLGADLERAATDGSQQRLSHILAKRDLPISLRALLEEGAEIDPEDYYGMTPLSTAIGYQSKVAASVIVSAMIASDDFDLYDVHTELLTALTQHQGKQEQIITIALMGRCIEAALNESQLQQAENLLIATLETLSGRQPEDVFMSFYHWRDQAASDEARAYFSMQMNERFAKRGLEYAPPLLAHFGETNPPTAPLPYDPAIALGPLSDRSAA